MCWREAVVRRGSEPNPRAAAACKQQVHRQVSIRHDGSEMQGSQPVCIPRVRLPRAAGTFSRLVRKFLLKAPTVQIKRAGHSGDDIGACQGRLKNV